MPKPKAIQCKSCNAPLTFEIESRQIESLTCEYCGQVHDVRKNFRTLHYFKNSLSEIRRIALGTKGKINDIDFMLIGYVVYTEVFSKDLADLEEDEYWIEYQVYSKTHGYAFLTYEEGEYFFYRKVRDLPSPLLSKSVEESEVLYRGLTFLVEEPYDAYVYAVAGSLTWTAKIGSKSNCIDASHSSGFFSSTEYFLSYEESGKEEEYYLGEPIYDLDYDFANAISSIKQKKKELSKPKSTRRERDKRKVIKSIRRKNRTKKTYTKKRYSGKSKPLFSLLNVSLLSFLVSISALFILLMMQQEGNIFKKQFDSTETIKQELMFHSESASYTLKLKFSLFPSEVIKEKIVLQDIAKRYTVFQKDLNLTSSNESYEKRFTVPKVGKYLLTVEHQSNTPAKVMLTVSKPILLRYFFFFMLVSIFGILIDKGRKGGGYTLETAYKLLFWSTVLLYLSALVPPFFLFLGGAILIFMGIAYGTVGFLVMLALFIYAISILT